MVGKSQQANSIEKFSSKSSPDRKQISSGKTVKTPGFKSGLSPRSIKSGTGGKAKRLSSKQKKTGKSLNQGSVDSVSQKYGSQSAYSGYNQNLGTQKQMYS